MENSEFLKEVLNSIDKELEFYRRKVEYVNAFSLAYTISIITGKETIKVQNELFASILYSFVLTFILLFSVQLSLEYSSRIYFLRDNRNDFLKKYGIDELFPKTRGKHSKKRFLKPSNLYLYLLLCLYIVAIFIVWNS